MKYCPYNVTVEQAVQTITEYDSDGRETNLETKLVETQRHTQCKEKRCASYRFGHCTRR